MTLYTILYDILHDMYTIIISNVHCTKLYEQVIVHGVICMASYSMTSYVTRIVHDTALPGKLSNQLMMATANLAPALQHKTLYN